MKKKVSQKRKMLIVEILIYVFMAIGIFAVAFVIFSNLKGFRNPIVQEVIIANQESPAIDENKESNNDNGGSGQNGPAIVTLSVDEAYQAYDGDLGYIFVDVRTVSEYESGHIEGAVLIPLSEMAERFSELPVSSPIVVYCDGSSCNRSGAAAEILVNNGFEEVYDLGGTGINEWIEKGYPNSQ